MNITQILQQLGLQDKEPTVYLELIKSPSPKPASIIAKRTGINRTTTYKALMSISQLGLATKTQRAGTTYFMAEDPEQKLKFLLNKQKENLELMNKTIAQTIPLLISNSELNEAPKIKYYEGIEGIKETYKLILKEKKNIYRMGDIHKIYAALGDYTDEFILKRNKLKITTHAIMPLKKDAPPELKKHKNEMRKVLYIPEKDFPIDGEIRIFGDNVSIISLKKDSAISVIIESPTIAQMFHSIFMLTWSQGNFKK